MPREACEFCRRARARHKTRKKAGIFWYSSRGLGRADWKQKAARFRQKSPEILTVRDSRHETSKVDKQDERNPRLQALVDLFKKEDEVEEVPSPKDSASILSETINNIEAVDDSLQPPVLTHTTNQMSKGGISTIESNLAEKPNLSHFKIAEITLQQCFDLLQSLPNHDQCIENDCR